MCRGSKICSLAPESKSHISDLEEIEQEKMDDIPETEEELIRLALGEGVDDEGSKFTCWSKLTSWSYFSCEILALGDGTSVLLLDVASLFSELLEALTKGACFWKLGWPCLA